MEIARREFELGGQPETREVLVLFEAPAKSGSEWVCTFRIIGLFEFAGGRAFGEDGVQALWLAMERAAVELYSSNEWKSGWLTWFGQRDLGLPVPQGFVPRVSP